jgi:dishevelled associated activator of morphogenesis
MKELEKDMGQLRNGMKEVGREIEFFRTQPAADGDRYLTVMKEFTSKTAVRLAELEDLFIDMKARFDRVCRLFCEDPATTQSDEFFGIFDIYITAFLDAKAENDAAKRRREEEEKMAKQQHEVSFCRGLCYCPTIVARLCLLPFLNIPQYHFVPNSVTALC